MSVTIGTADVTAAYIGTTPLTAIYVGTELIWPTATVPGAPTGLVATAANASAALTWTAPASNGGAAITDYVVQSRPLWPSAIDVLHPTRRWPLGEASGNPVDAIAGEVGAVGGSPTRNVAGPGATGGGIAFANTSSSSPSWGNLGYFAAVGNGDDDEVTFSFWLKTTYTGLADVWGCGYYSDNPAFAPIILFEINGSSITGPADGHLSGFFAHTDAITDPFPGGTSGVIWEVNSPTVNFRDGQWHSFALVYNRTAKTVTVYVDGTAQTISTYHANTATWGTLAPWPNVYIGQGNNDPNPGTNGRPGVPQTSSPAGVTGSLDEFTVIPSVITAADVARIDRAGRGTWTTFSDAVTSSTGATVTGLTNDVAYEFRVAAVNSVGAGAYSSTASATPVAPPSGPAWSYDFTAMADGPQPATLITHGGALDGRIASGHFMCDVDWFFTKVYDTLIPDQNSPDHLNAVSLKFLTTNGQVVLRFAGNATMTDFLAVVINQSGTWFGEDENGGNGGSGSIAAFPLGVPVKIHVQQNEASGVFGIYVNGVVQATSTFTNLALGNRGGFQMTGNLDTHIYKWYYGPQSAGVPS